jgi:hypothetical protein
LVYLVSSTEAIQSAGLPCVISDGNAATWITDFSEDLADLETMVDWPLMRERIWRNTAEDPDRVRRRMAEFLVHGEVPLDLISTVAVKDARMRDAVAAVAEALGCEAPVVIRPEWYF